MSNVETMRDHLPAREASMAVVLPGFGSLQSFELMQREAKMLSSSTLVPVQYRAQKEIKDYGKVVGYEENPSAIPNCVIALNMSQRLGADVLMVMQNLYIVEGRPSWSAQFVAASINASGRFSPLRFELSEPGQVEDVTYNAVAWVNGKKESKDKTIKVTHRTCYAWAKEKATGDIIKGPVVSMQMSIDEGWITKNGSKWQTMPEVMLHYRATSFFGKLHAPDLLMGLQTTEELQDIIETERNDDGQFVATESQSRPGKASRVQSATEKAKSRSQAADNESVTDAEHAETLPEPETDEAVIETKPTAEQDSFLEEMDQAERQTSSNGFMSKEDEANFNRMRNDEHGATKPSRSRPALNVE